MRQRLIALTAGIVIAPLLVIIWVEAAGAPSPWIAAALAIVALSLLAMLVLQRPRMTIAGGLLLGVGLPFAYVFVSQAQRCLSARGCTLGDNTVQISILSAFVVAGFLTSAYALTRPAANEQ